MISHKIVRHCCRTKFFVINALQFLGKQFRHKYQAKSAPMSKQIASVHPQCSVLLPLCDVKSKAGIILNIGILL